MLNIFRTVLKFIQVTGTLTKIVSFLGFRCNEKQFTLHYYDVIDSELEGQLHEMLRYIRREQSQVNFTQKYFVLIF